MKIGDNPISINSASLLELETSNKGFVPPRVSITDVGASSPLPSGLLPGTMVYNKNASITGGSGIGIYYWDGSKWNFLATSTTSFNYWSLTGNAGTSASANFIGTTDAIDFVTKTRNVERMRILGANNGSSKAGWVGMGNSTPRSSLDVTGNYTNKNVLTIQNTSNTGYSSVDMMDDGGNLRGTFGYANSGTGAFFSGKDYFNIYSSDFVFTTNSGTYNFFMSGTSGYIGINNNTPKNNLDVYGSQAIGTYAGTNPAPLNGLIVSGNVGIGMSSPGYKLSVSSSSNPLYLAGVSAITSLGSGDSVMVINNGVVKKTAYRVLSPYDMVKTTGTLNSTVSFPILGLLTTVAGTITVSGAAVGNSVIINPRTSLPLGISISYSYVSSSNTITVYFLPSTLGLGSISTTTQFDITLIQ